MASNLKVFVCEFITGGGLYNAPLPPSLAREGQAMLAAMLTDMLDVPGVEVMTTRDARLPPLSHAVTTRIANGGDICELWHECIAHADAVWAVAPESGGELEALAVMAQSKWLGCNPETIRIAASKRATAKHLANHDIPVVPTYQAGEWMNGQASHGWIAKPDDGVGCDDMRRFDDADGLRDWLKDGRMHSHIVQPWLEGEAASISMLCRNGQSQVLSCNRQLITVDQDIHYGGSRLNDMAMHWDAFEAMAARIAAALPGLAGYVGVDVLVHQDGITVIEINPRLTTSYAGLRRAIGRNPAELVLDLHYNGRFIETGRVQRNVVEVNVDD